MIYDISASIDYSYQVPAVLGRTLLRLMPATVPGAQRLVAGALSVTPGPSERIDRADFFGNAVTELAFRTAARSTVFRLQARVERLAQAPSLDLTPPLDRIAEELRAVPSLGPDSPHHFLGASDRVRPRRAITAYARTILPAGATALAAVQAVGRALHADMRFDATATTVETDPLHAFTARHGVCQDFSHVMIAALRGLGIPAGYVSGYLRTLPPAGEERLAGADAMHAWVRAWTGIEGGWVEFDPTNDLMVAADHVLVAVGRDYDDVAPVKGSLRIAGAQESLQRVDVIPLGPRESAQMR
ncbi:transglutaminase family protein [Frigidibacter oleivorans]|uniref:transglutaminase family protein n=1 Tax=Frigidibacter oleivorans TaxID=2487129 RepID=UPI000F8D28B0|nr:transglutaminase family protein [Frigidibacter oleivorans]